MRDEYWPLVDTVARKLAEERVDPSALAQVGRYLSTHRAAEDFFALLDELAGPAGTALARSQAAPAFAALRAACQPLRAVPASDLPEAIAWTTRLLRYHAAQLPPLPRGTEAAAPVPPPAPGRPTPSPRPAPPQLPAEQPTPPPVAAARPTARPVPPARGEPPAAPRPAAARTPHPPAAARAPHPPGARRPPAPPRPEEPPARPEPPVPESPREPTMDELLRALQARFEARRRLGNPPPAPRGPDPAESKRERLRRQQQEIMERYRRQYEASDE
ncbi:MAG TPA: hypothetical protein VFB73_03505 [Chloroflexota bacterium]|nr:hypothetical protein [Chloroflexota bacterium]